MPQFQPHLQDLMSQIMAFQTPGTLSPFPTTTLVPRSVPLIHLKTIEQAEDL